MGVDGVLRARWLVGLAGGVCKDSLSLACRVCLEQRSDAKEAKAAYKTPAKPCEKLYEHFGEYH